MRVAIVYDRVNKWGGAERVLLALHDIFPHAPLYTSVYNTKTALWAKVFPKVVPSFLQKFPFARDRHDLYALFMPFVFESHDFSKFDIVISVSSEAAKGIVTKPSTLHINYCLTPTRYLWSGYDGYFNNRFKKAIALPAIKLLKSWDRIAAYRPDEIIAISTAVKERVEKYYNRQTKVIYPPVDLERFQVKSPQFKMAMKNLPIGKYYLIVSRLVPYKKIDLAIEAFNKLNLPLVIVGNGSEYSKLRGISRENVRLTRGVSEEDLIRFYKSCRAFIMPQEEDFGIASLEAQACGKPVIAFRKGGALETIIEDKTGIFFNTQTVIELVNAVKRFEKLNFEPQDCVDNAKNFSYMTFKKNFMEEIKRIWYTKRLENI